MSWFVLRVVYGIGCAASLCGWLGEELPWWDWDVNVSEGFLEGEKLVGGLKLEFVF